MASNLPSAFEVRKSAPDLTIVTMRGEYIFAMESFSQASTPTMAILSCNAKFRFGSLRRTPSEFRSIIQHLEKQKDLLLAQVGLGQQTVREKRDSSQRMQVDASTLHGQLSLLDRELREAEGKVKSLNWERNNVRQRLDAASGKVASIEQELSNNGRELDRFHKKSWRPPSRRSIPCGATRRL